MPRPVRGSAPLEVLVVSHTHWDREWYHVAGRFRQRLVELVDALLAAWERGPFLLDGQAVVLDDYLAVRPERRDALAARVQNGSIEAGPWYVLADELLPSAEALVRNLLAGRRAVRALGGEPPPVLYCPDSFGHPAALPALAAGFGLPVTVLWRGLGGRGSPAVDTMRWRAPDGSETLVHHLSPHGYELGESLPLEASGARERWVALRAVLAPRAVLGVALLPNGADHHAPQPARGEAIAMLARAAAPDLVRTATVREVAEALVARAAATDLPVISGELRDSYGYAWTLQGTFGTRAAQKRRNAEVERLLVRDAEPWAALARLDGAPSRAPLVRAAWSTLLLAHPHDTLCGCSLDEVARAMDARLDDAAAQARGVREDALLDLVAHDRASARGRAREWRPVVLVRNRAARPRGGVAELELLAFARHVRVGGPDRETRSLREAPALSLDGGRVPVQVLERGVRHDRVESPLHYPDDDLVHAVRAVAWMSEVPAYGVLPLTIDETAESAAEPSARVDGGDDWMENEWLRVEVDGQGRVRLVSKRGRDVLEDLLGFEDARDAGDLYTPSPREPVIRGATFLGVEPVHRGPLRAALRLRWRMDVPQEPSGERLAVETAEIPLTTTLTLDADAGQLVVEVQGVNEARDHRLRVVFRTGVSGARVFADAAFGPVERRPILATAPRDEQPLPTAPLHRYVTLAAADRGATIVSDGLAEYEATPSGDVAITLVRAVGELSRDDLPERPGHAGWPTATPGAQCPGPFAARFAVLPHGAYDDTVIERVERAAEDVLLPLEGETLRSALRLPPLARGVELVGEGLAFGACKESEDGEWVVLRCVNLLARHVRGIWRLPRAVERAWRSRLDETPLEPLLPSRDEVAFDAAPREIVTILLRAG